MSQIAKVDVLLLQPHGAPAWQLDVETNDRRSESLGSFSNLFRQTAHARYKMLKFRNADTLKFRYWGAFSAFPLFRFSALP
jgi:hypothetical protein